MTSETPKPNARSLCDVRLPLLGASRFTSRSLDVFLDNVAHTAADHVCLESGGHRGQVVLQVMETQAVGQSSSGDGACSVDEHDLARDVCARGRSKQDCGAHHFLGLGDATYRSSGHSHFLPLRIAPKILGEGGPNH